MLNGLVDQIRHGWRRARSRRRDRGGHWSGRRAGPGRDLLAHDLRQRQVERALVGDASRGGGVREDHLLQLGQALAGRGRLQVPGLEVQEGVADRHHQQVALNDARSLLVQQREVTGDLRRLLNATGDLRRSQDHLVLGQYVRHHLAVVGGIVPYGQPADQVLLAEWSEGDDLQVLGLALAGQPHLDVVGGEVWRHLPDVLAVVEGGRVGHVVRAVDLCLHGEKLPRYPEVRLQAFWHLVERLEQRWESVSIGPDDRVVPVGDE